MDTTPTTGPVGRSVPRREDPQLLRGEGTFIGDLMPDGCLHAAFLRSTEAHAEIERLDTSAAQAAPGVHLVLTGTDMTAYARRMEPYPFQSRDPFRRGNPTVRFHDRFGLALDKVRFVGEPVALVVAEDRYLAEDALELIDVSYRALPPVLDAEAGAKDTENLLYPDWETNVALEFEISGGDVAAAFEDADVIVEETIDSHRFSGTPIEPRGVLASYEPDENILTVWDTAQQPHVIATLLEASIIEPAGVRVRVRVPKIGGGFGQKYGFYPEELVIPISSVVCGRPVKWIETRREHMIATVHAREQRHHIRVGLTNEGRIVALQDEVYADLGDAYPTGGVASALTSTLFVPGAYDVQHYQCNLYGVATNKTPFGAHRGFGKAEPALAIERMMDKAAVVLGLDPAEIRHRNFIQPEAFPYRSVTGSLYDSGDYPRALDLALQHADYPSLCQDRDRRNAEGGRYRMGVGMALVIEPSSATRMGSYNSGYYSVRIRMEPNGSVSVATGGNDEGQGHLTSVSQLVAQELGVPLDAVRLLEGDTFNTPYGSGSYASRFGVVGSSGVIMASRELSDKIKRIASSMLEVDVDDLELVDGRVRVRDRSTDLALQDVCRVAYHLINDLPEDEEPGLELTHHFRDPNIDFQADERGRISMFSSFPYAADVAAVLVDTHTGAVKIERYVSVHDCGNMINPRIVEGQHLGALAHGIGGAMLEEFTFDDRGKPQNRNFKEYLIPTARDIPDITMDHIISPNPFTPGGFKGAGETGTVSPVPCLANAVEDALRPLGVENVTTPLTPANIWRQLTAAPAAIPNVSEGTS